ncbi:cytidine deaminase-like protein [Annulohypoxylon moriforme]|nr:cytidine deaminase-like protein [Annulohypoxylon moriforme]
MGDSMNAVVETLDPISKRLLPPEISKGTLVPLKTIFELRDYLSLCQVYVTRAPQKSTSGILEVAKRVAGNDGARNLPHLRRCIKPADLPPHLKTAFVNEGNGRNIHMAKSQWLYILLGPKSELSYEELEKELRAVEGMNDEVWLGEISVPLIAPTSQSQALMWSHEFWQSIYRKNNPHGPHPSTVSRIETSVARDAHVWVALAHQIAKKAQKAGMGEPVGAVIIKRTHPGRSDSGKKQGSGRKGAGTQKEADDENEACDEEVGDESDAPNSDGEGRASLMAEITSDMKQLDISQSASQSQAPSKSKAETKETTQIVAIAGDARWHKHGCFNKTGNPMAHAALRAISMVAQKLVRSENRPKSDEKIIEFECFQDKPLLHDEQLVFDTDHPSPDGYLCHDLELYLTHEPCTMCSMGILHSRMGKVIFCRRMPLTGSMTSEDRAHDICSVSGDCEGSCGGGQGLGLHWRKELNWTLLGWEWEADKPDSLLLDPHTHA